MLRQQHQRSKPGDPVLKKTTLRQEKRQGLGEPAVKGKRGDRRRITTQQE